MSIDISKSDYHSKYNSSSRLKRAANWARFSSSDICFKMVSNISSDSKGRIYVAHRGEHPIAVFSGSGEYLDSVGDSDIPKTIHLNLDVSPPEPIGKEYWLHGLHIDHWDNVWITDLARNIVMKFSPEGELLMTLGTDGKRGCDSSTFSRPTSVAVSQNGDVYVADGYGNSRVVKFDSNGVFLHEWGSKGDQPGQFNLPHAIAISPNGNVVVAERLNSRIQIFDPNGNALAVCPNLPNADGLTTLPDSTILVGTAMGETRLHRISEDGILLDSFATQEEIGYPHGLHFTTDDVLFIADPITDNAVRPPTILVES